MAGAYFMEILDGTILAPAAPAMARELGVTPVQVNVVLTTYLLTVAVFIPGSGWLADRFGVRSVFLGALVIFTLASAGCATASTLGALVAARVAQGVGGALMVPVGRLAILRSTPKSALMTAIAYLTWPAPFAPVLAPTLGGVLSTYASWRWIFVVNLPLGTIAVLVGLRLLPVGRPALARALDWPGLLLVAGTVAALTIGLELLGGPDRHPVGAGRSRPRRDHRVGGGGASSPDRAATAGSGPAPDPDAARDGHRGRGVPDGRLRRAVPGPALSDRRVRVDGAHAGVVMIALFAGNLGIKPLTTPIMRRS